MKIWTSIFTLLLTCLLIPSSSGQNQNNPFDVNRGGKSTQQAVESTQNPFDIQQRVAVVATAPLAPEEEGSNNPFDVEETEVAAGPATKYTAPTVDPVATLPEIAPPGREDRGLLFWVMMTLSLFITVVVAFYRQVLVKAYRSCLNGNYMELVHREQAGSIRGPYLLLFLFFGLSLGVLLYLFLTHLDLVPQISSSSLLWGSMGITTGALLLKLLVVSLIGWVFPLYKTMSLYRFTIITSGIILGLFIAFLNLLIAFSPDQTAKYLLYGSLFVLVLFYGFRIFRGFTLSSNYLFAHPFHFFLYLCTVEIAPVLVILKLAGI